MSIILFTNSLDYGGTGTFFMRMNHAFQNENIDSNILAFNNEREIDKNRENLLEENLYKRIRFLREQCKEKKCETIITNYGLETLVARLATIGLRKKVKIISVVHIRSIMFIPESMSKIKKSIFKLLIKLSFKVCNKCVAVSNDLKSELIKENWVKEDKVVTIYNPVIKDDIEFKPRMIKENQDIHIGLIGWIWDIKNQKEAVKAINELKNKNIKLHLIGGIKDNKYYEELVTLINNLKLNEQVIFEGLKNDIFNEIDKLDILILTSKTEALPTVIIEALSYSLPVISTDCKVGPSEILNYGEFGLIYECQDYKMLSNLIFELINDKSKYEYLNNKSYIRSKKFTYNNSVKGYLNII